MMQFVDLKQESPVKRNTNKRKDDFNEIYNEFITDKAKDQSSRCSQCGVPFCQIHCPLGNNIPDWLKLTAEGRLKEAYEISQSTNNMPEVCGRICPQDRPILRTYSSTNFWHIISALRNFVCLFQPSLCC